jgi:hypothetical protein
MPRLALKGLSSIKFLGPLAKGAGFLADGSMEIAGRAGGPLAYLVTAFSRRKRWGACQPHGPRNGMTTLRAA